MYTKKGDKGKTMLFGGTMVSKNHVRINAYGTVDELNSFIGQLYDCDIQKVHKDFLKKIQNQLFNLGSTIAFDQRNQKLKDKLPTVYEEDILALEKEIDRQDEDLPPLKNFILPSGHPHASKCHICRTVCRRAERAVYSLLQNEEGDEVGDWVHAESLMQSEVERK